MINNSDIQFRNKHIPWVTFAKFLGLYLMILGHMSLVDAKVSAFIYIFHMPLFFILSGMFHKNPESRVQLAEKLWKKLIIPFLLIALIWCLIYIPLWIKNDILDLRYWMNYILGTFLSPGKPIGTLATLRSPLWFLLALAEIKLLSSFVTRRFLWLIISAISIVAILLLKHYNLILPLALDAALLALPFYAIGVFTKKHTIQDYPIWVTLIIAMLCGAATYGIYIYNGIVDINHCLYGNNMALFYLGGLTGSLMIYFLSKAVQPITFKIKGFLFVIVSGALLIIGFSQNISSAIRSVLPILANSNIGGFAIGALTIAVIYPLILLAQRFFPAILGYRK